LSTDCYPLPSFWTVFLWMASSFTLKIWWQQIPLK
jgi:hypothetical protein